MKKDRSALHTINIRKANWIGNIWRRDCLLKHVIEGNIEGKVEVMERRGRRRWQLVADIKEKKGYWRLKEEGLIPLCG